MTFAEAYTSLKSLYKKLMFESEKKWTMTEIDQLDVHFFYELMDLEDVDHPQEKEVYLSDVW